MSNLNANESIAKTLEEIRKSKEHLKPSSRRYSESEILIIVEACKTMEITEVSSISGTKPPTIRIWKRRFLLRATTLFFHSNLRVANQVAKVAKVATQRNIATFVEISQTESPPESAQNFSIELYTIIEYNQFENGH